MKFFLLMAFTFSSQASSLFAATLWSNPPVLCPEEILAKGLPCPDLSQVPNPYTDFPDRMTKEEMVDWKNNKRADLDVCRNREVLRRESIKAGSFSSGTLELAWMVVDGGKRVKEKLDAIQSASEKYEIPAQILIGAMKQESLLATLGVAEDGGNYSCGMSQLNIQEWCNGMNNLSQEEKLLYGWPEISCDSKFLPTEIIKPFFNIASHNIGNRPLYQLSSNDFQNISFGQVKNNFPSGDSSLQSARFQAATSFVNNCQNIALSVNFKAATLRNLFDNFVPEKLKNEELYSPGATFPRVCQNAYNSSFYPLHTGWLLAVAMYNAGPAEAKLVGSYYKVKNNNFPAMTPLDLIEALHWGGKYKKRTDNVVFKDQNGDKMTQSWFKSCIVQRHVARVIQHVTIPSESIAKSLEQAPCVPGKVPAYRKSSSGVK